jgi:maleate isomerase
MKYTKSLAAIIMILFLIVFSTVCLAGDLGNARRAGDLGSYGWRGRIGVITPAVSKGVLIELEFNQLKPVGTDMIVENVYLGPKLTEEALVAMGKDMVGAAERLKNRGADVLLYGCTTGSLVKGMGYDKQLVEQMKEATGLPSATMAGAVVEALKTLKLKKIVLVTPYPEQITEKEIAFFKENGIVTISHITDNYAKGVPSEFASASPGLFYRLAKQAFVKDADGVFLSCGNIRTIEIIDYIEKDLGVPVVSSIQASIWKALRMAGINEKIEGYGRLLKEH